MVNAPVPDLDKEMVDGALGKIVIVDPEIVPLRVELVKSSPPMVM
jgi:hypothetical protein